METPSTSTSGYERNLRRLDRLLAFLLQQGALDEWLAWWHEQRARPDYCGFSGAQLLGWIEHNHPELAQRAQAIVRLSHLSD